MDVIVVYESVFGNTRVIAEAIAEGAGEADRGARVAVLGIAEATPDKIGEAALLVAGGPTHIRGMSTLSAGPARKNGASATVGKLEGDRVTPDHRR